MAGDEPDRALRQSRDDRAAVIELIERYTASLDDGGYDEAWARAMFTPDVVLTYPVGSHEGRAGVDGFLSEVMGRWARTHHHTSNYLVEPDREDRERAQARWSVIASHVHPGQGEGPLVVEPFQLGGWFSGTVVHGPGGWRFARMRLRIAWTRGAPVLDTGTVQGRSEALSHR